LNIGHTPIEFRYISYQQIKLTSGPAALSKAG
jgi:hypothetical protein